MANRFVDPDLRYITIEPGPKPAPATKKTKAEEGTDEAGK
jgi:hypothetical protein